MVALEKIALKAIEKKAIEQLAKEGEKTILRSSDLGFSRMSGGLCKLALAGEKFLPHLIDEAKAKLILNETKDISEKNFFKNSEISFKGNIEKEFPWAGELGNYNNSGELVNALAKSEAENEMLKIERHPAKLPADVALRIVEDSETFSAEKWAEGSFEDRVDMLNKAFEIIAEEACIPQEAIDSGIVLPRDFGDRPGEETNAAVNIFVNATEDGKIYQDMPIIISFNENHLLDPNYNFHDAISTLYHEVIHAMQQQSVCEGGTTFTYAEMQKEWREDIMSSITDNPVEFNKSKNRSDYIDYISGPMETYAHLQTDYFKKILTSTEIDADSDNTMYLYDTETASKGAADISFGSLTKLITVPEELGYQRLS